MIEIKPILELMMLTINELERSNFYLKKENNYRLINLNPEEVYTFEGEEVAKDELKDYFSCLYERFSYLKIMIGAIERVYKEGNNTITFDDQTKKFLITITIQHGNFVKGAEIVNSTLTQ